MTKVERSIVINATPEEVEAIHNDISRLTEWYSGLEKTEWEGGEYPRVGGRLTLTYKAAGMTFDLTSICLEYEYARIGRYRMEGMITGKYEEILDPLENGTRFTMIFDYQMPGGGVGKIVDRLFVERMNVKNLEDSLENLKALVELQEP